MPAIRHEQLIPLSDLVARVTADNPGLMTGPGTNTYIIGREQLALVDPGPANDAHIESLLDIVGDRLRWVLVTHTHPDHSPAAKRLVEATGARLMGNILPVNDGLQDDSFVPDQSFRQDELFTTPEFTLRALLTPGHVGNHVCYLLEDEGLLLTGDHIMQGSTVVIVPPHGNMRSYIESLQLLLDYQIKAIAPGHGDLIDQPQREVEYLIKHRLAREAKVISALEQLSPASIELLTSAVYDDVSPTLHPVAQHSLHAHLLKLESEERVSVNDGLWRLLSRVAAN